MKRALPREYAVLGTGVWVNAIDGNKALFLQNSGGGGFYRILLFRPPCFLTMGQDLAEKSAGMSGENDAQRSGRWSFASACSGALLVLNFGAIVYSLQCATGADGHPSYCHQ